MRWWDELSSSGPAFGYFPNAKKCWLITKPEKEEEARAVFGATAINITTEGHKHLGAALGSRSYFEEYVGQKVEDWVSQVMKLAEFAVSQPQASYVAFTFGLRHRWTYFLRTLPDIADLLDPLERAISDVLIPALLEHQVTETERDLLALPVRMGGLGLVNPVNQSRQEYEASIKATAPLVKQIIKQAAEPPNDEDVAGAQRRARQEKADSARRDLEDVTESLPLKTQRQNGRTKFEISRLKFCKRCVLTSRWTRFSKKLRGKCCRGEPTRPLTRGWISVRGASGRENSLRSLMLGYATLMQTRTRISPRSRLTSFTRMIKSAFTRLEFLR